MQLVIETGVYQTSGDSVLMAECVKINADQNFLEVGCGSGFVSLSVAKHAKSGLGVDINDRAVQNSRTNALKLGIENVAFMQSDVFEHVDGLFDVIICNPPYTNHSASDAIDCMFWDENDAMKRRFFTNAADFLKPEGRIYFGWADFADLDVALPYRLAEENNYILKNTYSKPHNDSFSFYVLEFVKNT